MEENKEIQETERVEEQKVYSKEVEEGMGKAIIEQSILENFAEFEILGKKYKIVRPTTAQKQEAYQKKVIHYMQLIKEKDDKGNYIYYPEKQLKKIYKERGLDITEIDNQINSLVNKRTDLQEKLGKALVDKAPDNELEILKQEITKINTDITELFTNKNSLLEYSLENQALAYLYEYLTFLISEVQNEKGEYEKAFKTFEEFRNTDNLITNTLGLHAGFLLGSL